MPQAVDHDRIRAALHSEVDRQYDEAITRKTGFFGKIGFELDVHNSTPGNFYPRYLPSIKLYDPKS